jgi:hypothetical protein
MANGAIKKKEKLPIARVKIEWICPFRDIG